MKTNSGHTNEDHVQSSGEENVMVCVVKSTLLQSIAKPHASGLAAVGQPIDL